MEGQTRAAYKAASHLGASRADPIGSHSVKPVDVNPACGRIRQFKRPVPTNLLELRVFQLNTAIHSAASISSAIASILLTLFQLRAVPVTFSNFSTFDHGSLDWPAPLGK